MSRPKVKICGITSLADAEAALRHGADALGFVFWPSSPRVVSTELASQLVATVPALVTCVGVFVNAAPDVVARTVAAVGLDAVQLHGDEHPDDYGGIGARLIKAASPTGQDEADAVGRWPSRITVLLDASDPERRGGTGRLTDWTLAGALARRRRVVLAGGLTADNVREAVATVRPWALDVSSGVESAPGVKDEHRLAAFFAAVDAKVETT